MTTNNKLSFFSTLILFLFLGISSGFSQTANNVVISEVYGGGGNTGAVFKNDFIELYNPTSAVIDLAGMSVQYASAAGTTWNNKTKLTGTIAAHGYFLIQEAAGTGTTMPSLPTPDFIGIINLSGTNGKVALVSDTTSLITADFTGANPTSPRVIDFTGYGTASNYEGSAASPAASNTSSIERMANATSTAISLATGGIDELAGNGWDSNNNTTDFVNQTSVNPQNSASPLEPSSSTPSLSIYSPVNGSTINSSSVEIIFSVNNFIVGNPGTGADGHLHTSLDWGNNIMIYSTSAITLTSLQNGTHTFEMYLVDDNHNPLNPAVSATVTFTVNTSPTLTITSPVNGFVSTSADVNIAFAVTNFIVGNPGTGADGHLHYSLDGGADVMVYNTNPIALTALQNGSHTVNMFLVDNNHIAISPAVSASVTFDVNVAVSNCTVPVGELTYGGFECWTAGKPDFWLGSKSSIAASSVSQYVTDVHGGTSAVKLVNATTSHKRFTTQPVSVVAGTIYTVSFWVRGHGSIRTALWDGRAVPSTGYGPYTPYDTINSTTWTQIVRQDTAAATTAAAEFILSVVNTVADLDDIQVDDVTITASSGSSPTLTIISPINGSTASGSTVDIIYSVSNFIVGNPGAGIDGHIHYSLDGGAEVMVYDTNPITLTALQNGSHTVNMFLVDNNHTPINPAVSASVTFIVNVSAGFTVSGIINYLNTNSTLSNLIVKLMNGTTEVASTTADALGNYVFSNISDGVYSIVASTSVIWGGVTATDALKAKRHIAGLELLTEPIKMTAADANNTGTINATDVLKIQRRIAGLDLSFARADWNFEKLTVGGNSITVAGADVIENLKALCTGDINASYLPVIVK